MLWHILDKSYTISIYYSQNSRIKNIYTYYIYYSMSMDTEFFYLSLNMSKFKQQPSFVLIR